MAARTPILDQDALGAAPLGTVTGLPVPRRVHFWPIADEERQLQLLAERVLPQVGR
jgi:hypothetical protein